jgi:hypothetical protein
MKSDGTHQCSVTVGFGLARIGAAGFITACLGTAR